MKLSCPTFHDGQAVPTAHTGDGVDVSPPLRWSDVPDGTQSFALVCDDPDAPRGTWVHWLIYNLPADARELPEGLPTSGTLPDGSKQGKNDFGNLGYGGPAPPRGKPHRYFFKLYALGAVLPLTKGATRAELERAMQGHILDQCQLIGIYQRMLPDE